MDALNIVDLIAALIVATYVVNGYRRGLWPIIARLLAFGGGLVLAFWKYQDAGSFILSKWQIMPPLGYAIGFLAAFAVAQFVLYALFRWIFSFLPDWLQHSAPTRALATVPAFVDGVISIAILMLLVSIAPFPESVKDKVNDSYSGAKIMGAFQGVEHYAQRAFGEALDKALTFLTVRPETDERVNIPFRPKSLSVSETDEEKMLGLVNAERAKAGAPPLVMDETLRTIARAHSRDMWERGYFSHVNPDGHDPFDRMSNGGAEYLLAGENLAMAPTLSLAHRGLMNSPGHRRNILDPNFGRIGIGVVDGGIYGKMFTQNFSN